MDRIKELELLNASLQGNTKAFGAIVEKYQSLVCAITYGETGRVHESEDLAQETFLLAWKNLGQLRDLRKFRGWLTRIARSRAQNWRRSTKRSRENQTPPFSPNSETTVPTFEPAEIALKKEEEEVISRALEHIPPAYREALVLYYREGHALEQVARLLGLKENNTRQRISRARRMLKAQVATMVEATLSHTRPGKTFTAGVITLLCAAPARDAAAVGGLITVGAAKQSSWTALWGVTGKLAIVVTGVAILVGTVLLHRADQAPHTDERLEVIQPTPPPQAVAAELSGGPSAPMVTENMLEHALEPVAQTKAVDPSHNELEPDSEVVLLQQSSPITEPLETALPEETDPAPILQGRITDADTGKPIVDAFVTTRPVNGTWADGVYHASTNADGIYVFKFVGDEGDYWIYPEANRYLQTPPRKMIELLKDSPKTWDFTLSERGATLLVMAFNAMNEPMEGVRLSVLFDGNEVHNVYGRIETNADGFAAFEGLSLGSHVIVAVHPDYALVSQAIELNDPQEVHSIVFSLVDPGLAVSGIATWSDGQPAAGLWVEVGPAQPAIQLGRVSYARISKDGTYAADHLSPGPHRFTVSPWFVRSGEPIWSMDINLPPTEGFIDIQLPMISPGPPVRLTGTVAFPGQEYPGGYRIYATGPNGQSRSAELNSKSGTPGQKRFILTALVPGPYDLAVVFGAHRHEFKNIQAPGRDIVLEMPLETDGMLRGRVIDGRSGRAVRKFEFGVGDGPDWNWQSYSSKNGEFEIPSGGPECQLVAVRAAYYREVVSQEICPNADTAVVFDLRPPVTVDDHTTNVP